MRTASFIFICSLFGILDAFSQAQEGYSIKGDINGVPDGTEFYLIRSNKSGRADTVAVTKSKNQSFLFTGSLRLEGEMHFVKMDTTFVKLATRRASWVRLLLDNSRIHLSGHLDRWPKVEIRGSKATREYDSLASIIKPMLTPSETILAPVGNTRNTYVILKKAETEADDKRRSPIVNQGKVDELLEVLRLFPDSYATPLIVLKLNRKTFPTDAKKRLYDLLSVHIRNNSFYGHELKEMISSLYKSEMISEGNIIPDFSITSPDGKRLSILEVAARSKLTLIDFWASWCKPCRAQIPTMLEVFNAFHDKGFGIIGISSDSKVHSWKKALLEDGTPWVQGLDEGDYKIGADIFGLQSIPAFVLIDNKGKLLAFHRGLGEIPNFGPSMSKGKLYETVEGLLKQIDRK